MVRDRALRLLARDGGDAGCAYLKYLSARSRPVRRLFDARLYRPLLLRPLGGKPNG